MRYFRVRFWGTHYPRVIHQRELHPVKVTSWYGVTAERVIGPYYFEDEDGNTVTVTVDRYREMVSFEMFGKLCSSCRGGQAQSHNAEAEADFQKSNIFANF